MSASHKGRIELMEARIKARALILFAAFFTTAAASSWGQTAFDGTWRIKEDLSKITPKPIEFSVTNGEYRCSSCNPKLDLKADGMDHPITSPYFDTMSVRVVDPRSIEIVSKKHGVTLFEQTFTVSPDGNTLSIRRKEQPPNGKEPITSDSTATRVAEAPAGADKISGSWRINKMKASENDLLTSYKYNGDEMRMTTPTGESYTAKLDGKDYPAKGGFAYNSVSLRRIDDHTIEETDKLNGKALQVWKMTVSADGKTMTQVANFLETGRTITYTAEKQ